MNATDWLADYAHKLGVEPPTKDELKAVLDLAGEAARASQRIAAPVACWLAARAGVELEEAIRLARELGSGGLGSGDLGSGDLGSGDLGSGEAKPETDA